MGVTHGNKKTYPRLADVLGFCTVEQGKHVAEKIMLVQRDNGNRVEYVFRSLPSVAGGLFLMLWQSQEREAEVYY